MQQAFRWECLDCKTENFDRAQQVPLEEIPQELLYQIEEDLEAGGEFVTTPESVTCRSCLQMFSTGYGKDET